MNPGLKSGRNVQRRLSALQGEVTCADQVTHYAVADPNRQAPQPHSGPRAVRLHPLGSRGLETRYIGCIAIRQRVASDKKNQEGKPAPAPALGRTEASSRNFAYTRGADDSLKRP